ncbi:HAD family hydrolase [Mycoplasma seminis]|uniref:HAD family hydrolase n=1 Tax=Mycoplasma seminis TaxID=512749 RepID=A0ABY9HB32_9MOLU|nr:HAD family hydrolase [Mycoplasma seminis]WLP85795.1 HAD family hydrolase [Mycoplasma seminis]
MNKKWAIFSDVDGTIYPFPDKQLSEVNRAKVRELAEKNIPFVINTGNPPLAKIQRLADELNVRYLCCSNGAMIYDNLEKKALHTELIDRAKAEIIWDLALKHQVTLYYMGNDQYYMYNSTPETNEFLTTFNEYNDWIRDGRINEDLHKIEAYGLAQNLENFHKACLQAQIPLDIINVSNKYIEITNIGISKASGMKWLCENVFQAPLEDVMVIGDSANDIPMFKAAGYSYAMDNADKLTKAAAKYYTSAVEQDGLAEAIDDYLYRSDFELKRAISQQQSKKNKK